MFANFCSRSSCFLPKCSRLGEIKFGEVAEISDIAQIGELGDVSHVSEVGEVSEVSKVSKVVVIISKVSSGIEVKKVIKLVGFFIFPQNVPLDM